MPSLTGIRCVYCDRPGRMAVCRGCSVRRRPTELMAWLKGQGMTQAELARKVGCSWRTILRATQGEPLSGGPAVRVSRITGISLEVLVLGQVEEVQRVRSDDESKVVGASRGAPGRGVVGAHQADGVHDARAVGLGHRRGGPTRDDAPGSRRGG